MPLKVAEFYRYRIDECDRVLNPTQEGEGDPASAVVRFLGGGETLSELCRYVRETGRPVRLPFCHQSAAFRRSGSLLLRPGPDRELHLRAAFRRVEPRPYFPFLDTARARHGDPVPTCRLCSRVRLGPDWCEPDELSRQTAPLTTSAPPPLEPSLCPDCGRAVKERTAI